MTIDSGLTGYEHVVRLVGDVVIDDLDREVSRHLLQHGALPTLEAVAFDLRKCRFLDLDVTLRLVPLLAELKQLGNSLILVLPQLREDQTASDSDFWSYLLRWRFFELLRRHVDAPDNLLLESQRRHLYESTKYLQARRPDDRGRMANSYTHRLMPFASVSPDLDVRPQDEIDAFLSAYRDLLAMRALTLECGFTTEEAYRVLSLIAEEGIINALAHSGGTYALLGMQILDNPKYHDPPCLAISVVDNGIGIPEVLRRAAQEDKLRLPSMPTDDDELVVLYTSFEVANDSLLVSASTNEYVTTSPERSGMGLYWVKDETIRVNGTLTIRSGGALVKFIGLEPMTMEDGLPVYAGTAIRVDIPIV